MTSKELVLCPRCESNHYTPYGFDYQPGDPMPPALSRVDNETYICSPCGTAEAMRDFIGAAPIPPSEWPISKEEA
jgi:hypothetical protein